MAISVGAVLSATLTTDSDGDGVADTGDTLRFTSTVTNNSTIPTETLTGVELELILNGVTLTGTVNVSPVAGNDSFTAVGNTLLIVGGTNTTGNPASVVAGNLFSNDVEFAGDAFELVGYTQAGNGSVTVNDDGTFTYISDAGFTGTDTFEYTITDGGLDGDIATAGDNLTSTATVTITVADQVWYVQEGATGGDGTSANPFGTLAAAASASGVNDYIYVEGNATGSITLDAGERLIGSGSALVVGGITLAAAGTNATMTAGGGYAVTLGSGNTVSGIDIVNTGGGGITGTGFGTLAISDVALDVSGQALNLTTGTVTGAGFNSVESGGGTNNVRLTTVDGTLDLGSGGVSGATSEAIFISGGNASVAFDGIVSHTANAAAIRVNSKTGGSVDFGGAVTSTGLSDGVSILGNSAGTAVNFNGGLTINTVSSGSDAFVASGGGTVTVTGAGNSISSGTGTALEVNGTNIGAAGLTFQSISASGGSTGIELINTGTIAGTHGGLTVTGTGTTDGSGGMIQNTSGRGASFVNTIETKLSNMNFSNAGMLDLDSSNGGLSTGDNLETNAAIHLVGATNVTLDNLNIFGGTEQGINGHEVTNFRLLNSTISNVGNEADEDGIHFYNMAGSSRIENTTITGSFDDNLNLQMGSGNLDLVISGGSVGNSAAGSGYLFGIRGTATANIELANTSSTTNSSGGIVADAFDTATMNLRVIGTISTGNNDQLSLSAGDSSRVDLEATGNTLRSLATGDFAVVSLLGSAFDSGYVFDARIHDNDISVANGLAADGIIVFNAGGGTINTAITNNVIDYGGTQRAVYVQSGQDGPGAIRAEITGNTIDMSHTAWVTGMLLQSAVTDPGGDGASLDMRVGGADDLANTFTHSGGFNSLSGDIRVRQRFDGSVNLEGYSGNPTDTIALANYLAGENVVLSHPTVTTEDGITGNASPTFVSVAVSAASVTEDGGTNLVYTFTRTGSFAAALSAGFQISGTASAASDYAVTGATSFNAGTGLGTVTFAAGSATATITVNPTADATAEADESVVVDVGNSATANGGFARALITNDDAPLFIVAGPAAPHAGGAPANGSVGPIVVDDGVLSAGEMALIVDAAIARWAAAGASPDQLAAMRAVALSVSDLGGGRLGASVPGTIVLDDNAGGWNWFVDATPGDDAEYRGSGTQLAAIDAHGQAGTRIDLLSVMMHELGHQIGLGDRHGANDADELMYGTIHAGERRLPGADEAQAAVPHGGAGVQFIGAPIAVAELEVGQSFTIQFDATVDAQSNQLIVNPVNQGTVTWGGPASGSQTTNALTTALDSLTLGGTVWHDDGAGAGGVAGDGVLNGTEAGIAGVIISLLADSDNSGTIDGAELTTAIASTTTDANGNYTFAGLAEGKYMVRIDQDNFEAGGAGDALVATQISSITPTEPHPADDDVDGDDNGSRAPGQPAFSSPITLAHDSEPTADGTGQFDINTTLDFGFLSNLAPVIDDLDGDVAAFTEGGAAVLLDDSSAPQALATLSDDQANLDGGHLIVSITANEVAAEDVLGIGTAGTVSLSDGTNVGSVVSVGGDAIGTIAADGSGGDDLRIDFDTADATPANVSALIQALTYDNTNDADPDATARTVTVTVNDGRGSDDSITTTVNLTAVNDEPTGTSSTITASEDVRRVLTEADFGYDDPDNDSLGAVVINDVTGATLLVDTGADGFDASDLVSTFPASVTAAQLLAGRVAILTASNVNGAAAATIEFQVVDDSGAVNDTDASPNVLTVDVTAVNDAPVLNTGGPISATEQTATAILAGGGVSDADLDARNGGEGDYAGATFSVNRNPATSAEDVFTLLAGPNFTIDGTSLRTQGGDVFATVTVDGSAGLMVIDFTSLDTPATSALVDEVIQAVRYTNISDTPPASVNLLVGFDDGSPGGGQGAGASNLDLNLVTVNITAVNDTPAIVFGPVTNATEQVAKDLKGIISIADADAASGLLTVTLAVPYGVLGVSAGTSSATVGGSGTGTVTIDGTLAQISALLGSDATSVVTFTADTDAPPASVLLEVTVNDNGNSGQDPGLSGDGSSELSSNLLLIGIDAVDDPATAQDDMIATAENVVGTGNVFADNGSGADDDPDGEVVDQVNGSTLNVGTPITLASGAQVVIEANGTLAYDPNGRFDYLISAAKAAATGAVNVTASDIFTYRIASGNTAMVVMTINGVDSAGDELHGDSGDNVINGTADDDRFWLFDGDDQAFGGGGDDFMVGGLGDDLLDGGSGNDTVSYEDIAGEVRANLLLQGPQVRRAGGRDTLVSIENVITGGGNDSIWGTHGDNRLEGGDGNDRLFGRYGDDVLIGGLGDDLLHGHQGNDTVSYADIAGEVRVNLLLQGPQVRRAGGSDTLVSIENVIGGAGDDSIWGTHDDNRLEGGDGNDRLFGRYGDDLLIGGLGDDLLHGHQGNDTVSYADIAGEVRVNLLLQGPQVRRAGGSDTLVSIENVITGGGNDSIWGTHGDNRLEGGDGNDRLFGRHGDDVLIGADGDDFLHGWAGEDMLLGGDGNDILDGGDGADRFVFDTALDAATNVDHILDFDTGADRIVLDNTVFTGLAPGALATSAFVTGTAASGANDRLLYDQTTGNLMFDADGSGAGGAVLFAVFDNLPVLSASDFIVV